MRNGGEEERNGASGEGREKGRAKLVEGVIGIGDLEGSGRKKKKSMSYVWGELSGGKKKKKKEKKKKGKT